MKQNNNKKTPNPNPASMKIKSAKPKYEDTKLFTLKELMNEVDKSDIDEHHINGHTPDLLVVKDINVHDFIDGPIEANTFDELKNLTYSAVKPIAEEETQAPNPTFDPKNKESKMNSTKINPKPPIKKKNTDEKSKVEDKKPKDPLKSIRSFEDRTKQYEEKRRDKQKKIEEEMKKACSFKPQINKKSALLDKLRHNGNDREKEAEDNYQTNKPLAVKHVESVRHDGEDKTLKSANRVIKDKIAKIGSTNDKYAIKKIFRSYSERNIGPSLQNKLNVI